jgi:hypothetical protein
MNLWQCSSIWHNDLYTDCHELGPWCTAGNITKWIMPFHACLVRCFLFWKHMSHIDTTLLLVFGMVVFIIPVQIPTSHSLTICLTSVFHDLCGVSVVLLREGLKWPVIAVFFFRPSNLFLRNRRPAQPMTFKCFQWSFKLGQIKSVRESFWYHRKLRQCCCVWVF